MVKIKGAILAVGKEAFMEVHGQEKYKQIINFLDKKERDVFLGQFWPAQWYPLDNYIHLSEVIIQEIYHGDEEADLRELVYHSMEKQFSLVYKAFLTFSTPEMIFKQIPKITNMYFQGVDVEVKMLEKCRALVIYKGFRKEDRVIEISIRAWWEKVLEAAHAKNVAFEIQTSIAEDKGFSEYMIAW